MNPTKTLTVCLMATALFMIFSCRNGVKDKTIADKLSSNDVKNKTAVAQITFGTVKDIDGNTYKTVKIGKQVWMSENLNVNHFKNDDLIPEAKTNKEWNKAGKEGRPAWCYYDNKKENGIVYGKLYNWYAVHDPRGLAPQGWHVPRHKEWTILSDFLGGDSIAGCKLKKSEIIHWSSSNTYVTGETGFAALPGGCRDHCGPFTSIGYYGCWWTITEGSTRTAWTWSMSYEKTSLEYGGGGKGVGFYVRCVKD